MAKDKPIDKRVDTSGKEVVKVPIEEIQPLLQESVDATKEDGMKRELKFNKDDLIEAFPEHRSELEQMGDKRDTVVIGSETNVIMTVRELRELCKRNPDGTLARQKRLSVLSLNENQEIALLVQDVKALEAGTDLVY